MQVLTVGSSLFDAIVSLENNPHIVVENRKASFSLGDKIPVDIKAFSIGGNGANVAASLQKLEISNAFYTYIGQDALSQFIAKQLAEEGLLVYQEFVDSKDGPLSIIFEFSQDRTIFSHHPEFEHIFDSAKVVEKPDLIYLTSVGKRWENAYEQVLSYASQQNIPIAYSPGSAQMKDINETFIKAVHQSKMLFCNMEEARIISKTLSGNEIEDKKELLQNLKNYGFELLSITDGAEGSYAVDDKNVIYKVGTLEPDGHERTGAGDAYAGAFLASYIQGLNIQECMKRGVLNSIGVMSKVGAHTGQLKLTEMDSKSSEIELIAEVI
jgi:sugar/nucleoside kinase (ribokinase family)